MTTSSPLIDTLTTCLRERYEERLASHTHTIPLFNEVRQQGYDLFSTDGLPTSKSEAYRYTKLAHRLAPFFSEEVVSAPLTSRVAKLPSLLQGIDSHICTIYHGALHPPSQEGDFPCEVTSLAEGYRRFPSLLNDHFNGQAGVVQDGWVALNQMFFDEGTFLYVPPHVRIEKPLLIHHFAESDVPMASFPRLLIVMGKHSQATIIETFSTTTSSVPAFVHRVGEIVLEADSELTYYPLQTTSPAQHHLRYNYVRQAERSTFKQHLLSAYPGDALVRDAIVVTLTGKEASTELHGLYRTCEQQHLALHTAVHHQCGHTSTRQHYKGLIQDRSTALFDGTVLISPNAQKSTASQQHKAWLRSDEATLYTRPQLSIEADDVQCSHGATTTQLDPTQLTYLRTRGLTTSSAERLLLQGFFSDEIEAIPHLDIQKIAPKAIFLATYSDV